MSEREHVGAALAEPVMPVEPDNHHNALLCPYCRPGLEERIEAIVTSRLAARDEQDRAEALAPVRKLAQEMSGDDCECEQFWTRHLAAVLPPERLAGEAGAE